MKSILLKLATVLQNSVNEMGSVSNFAEIYKKERENFLRQALTDTRKLCKEQEQQFSSKSMRYEKGSTLLLMYYEKLTWLLQVISFFFKEKHFLIRTFDSMKRPSLILYSHILILYLYLML